MIGKKLRQGRPFTAITLGLVFVGAMTLVGLYVAFQPQLQNFLAPGETVTAEFSQAYRNNVVPYQSTVKLAGVQVGKVSSVELTPRGTALITMKADADMDQLGPMPSASIEPLTVLGGGMAVELYRGGGLGAFDPDTVIPLERTRTPVELDPILAALPRETRTSLQGTVSSAEKALAQGGSAALGRLVTAAPPALAPTGEVLQAAQGTRPGRDLPDLVTNLEATASVVSDRSAKVGEIVRDLHTTTTALAGQSAALGETINKLPPTLVNTRKGLARLDGTLDRLTDTAGALRPTAKRLPALLKELNPVLRDARPVVRDLRSLLEDARPVVEQLTPTVKQADSVLTDVRGPVIERVKGPIVKDMINKNYRGTGPFEGSGGGEQADHLFYQELGYAVTGLGRASQVQSSIGALINFQVGAGPGSLNAGALTLEKLAEIFGAPGGIGSRAAVPGLPTAPVPNPAALVAPQTLGGGR